MTNQVRTGEVQISEAPIGQVRISEVKVSVEHDVLGEPCPRCESTAVRVVVYAGVFEVDSSVPADAAAVMLDGPLFDCRECGFEWGELVRDLMR